MDTNTILLWLACVSAGLSLGGMLIGIRRRGFRPNGWFYVSLAILASAGLFWLVRPAVAGYVSGGLWLAGIVAPMYAQRWVRRLAARQQFGRARFHSAWLRWLHPWDGWLEQPQLLRALELGERGRVDEAVIILRRLRDSRHLSATASVHLFRLLQDWPDLVGWVRHVLGEGAALSDPTILPMYLRALGETGDLPGLLMAFDRGRRHPAFLANRAMNRLCLFAFCGDVSSAQRLLDGPLSAAPADVRAFWLATAETAAGRREAAEARLRSLLLSASPGLRRVIEHRLSHPPPQAGPILGGLGPGAQDVLYEAEQERDQESRYGEAEAAPYRPLATWVLIGLNVAAFLLEVSRQAATDDYKLYLLGALYYPAVRAGQWWRLLTANFLHFGWLHLTMNMLGLYVLGPFAERALGRFRYVLVYLLCGLASMTAVLGLQRLGRVEQEQILVGASGAIMGLVGVTAGVLLRGWLRERAVSASRRLRWVMTVVAIQVVFDAFNRQVSSTAHVSGMLFGFALTLLIFRPPEGRIHRRGAEDAEKERVELEVATEDHYGRPA